MKLIHTDYTFQINFREGFINHLIVERPEVMSDFVIDLKKQIEGKEGKWILSDNGEVRELAHHCELILNLFDLDINQRKMINAMHNELSLEINDTELLMDWRRLNSDLAVFLDKVIENVDYDIIYNELDIKALFKTVELKFQEHEEHYVEYLLEYLQLTAEVRGIHIFIFVNLSSFLKKEELEYLYEQAFYKKIYLLLMDAHDFTVDKNVERKIILDADYCIIDTNM